MPPRFTFAALAAFLASMSPADDARRLTVTTSKALPPIESVAVYATGAVKPGKSRPKPLLTITKLGEPAALPGAGPFDVYAKPKDGIEVLVATKLEVKPGQTHALKLADALGVVEVFQAADFPKVDRIVITAPDDPGPDEKGHVPVQVGSDYRVEMPVPEGFYAVWLVPANGARAKRAADRIRVLPGKAARVGE